MRLAFVTGAIASGIAVAALATVVVWVVTLVTGSGDAWGVAAWLVPAVGVLAALATYVDEIVVDRLTQQRKRATGEPWAYRE